LQVACYQKVVGLILLSRIKLTTLAGGHKVPTKGFRDETLNFSYAEILGLASLRCFAYKKSFSFFY